MAMTAGLIAQLRDIGLQSPEGQGLESERVLLQNLLETVFSRIVRLKNPQLD